MATLFENQQTLLDILSNKRSIRNLFTDIHIEDIEKIVNRQAEVLKERVEEKRAEEEMLKAKKMLIEQAKEKIAELGLSIEDLLGVEAVSEPIKQKRTRRSPDKVHFLFLNDKNDVEHLHRPNSGRFPESFNSYLAKTGLSRDELIFSEKEVSQALKLNKLPTEILESDDERDARIEAELSNKIEDVEIDVDSEEESFGNK
ncbi:hypothetical protein Q9X96_003448 [Vibrio vulnificus]|nr:hypothetical protein [Vibrio vulnificus]